MTKAELVKIIANRTGVERAAVLVTVEELMSSIKDSLTEGENVYLRGFGTFEIKHRAAKKGRNISKNSSVLIPEHNIPKFKPSKEFLGVIK